MLGKILSILALALLAGPLTTSAIETTQATGSPGARSESLPGLIREAEKGVFFIRVKDSSGKLISMGTGFLTNKSGAVLTSLHVIRPTTGCAASAEALAVNGKAYAVKGVTVGDEPLDLAVLQLADVPEDAVPITLEMLMRMACGRDCPVTVAADVKTASDQLIKNFRDDRRMLVFLRGRPMPTLPEARGFLRALTEQSADAEIRSLAAISLALALETDMQGESSREAAIKFARVAAACPPEIMLGRETVAAMANNLVEKLTLSSVGCAAPALAGKDRKGEALALGDYRGR